MSVHPQRREVFNWLDFGMIVGFMLGVMLLLAALLAFTTWLSAWLAGRQGGDRELARRFVELGYQYAPVAMVSLVLGLGGELFTPLQALGAEVVSGTKLLLFLLGVGWSLHLGASILRRQGIAGRHLWLPLLPGVSGSLLVGLAWWPAIFGL
ncbi:MAG: hypothetical protein OQL28_16390 [Sedimenticola sp.]|nr:hypothetical protein [Sedimenticola sp.]